MFCYVLSMYTIHGSMCVYLYVRNWPMAKVHHLCHMEYKYNEKMGLHWILQRWHLNFAPSICTLVRCLWNSVNYDVIIKTLGRKAAQLQNNGLIVKLQKQSDSDCILDLPYTKNVYKKIKRVFIIPYARSNLTLLLED